MKKIILFSGCVETLEFFSMQLKKAFDKMGYSTYVFNMNNPIYSLNELKRFCFDGDTCMVTFNFIGLSEEDIFNNGKSLFFNEYNITCINIVVDHPFYYHTELQRLPDKYLQFCIDRTHISYMKRFYKHIKLGPFLPLAGTEYLRPSGRIPIADRTTDIIFTGNYTAPDSFDKHIRRINDTYTDFYYGIIDDLISNPDQTMDETFEKHIRNDIPDISDKALTKCMANMIFIDLYVRFYMRGKVVKTLVDNGYPVHVYGAGFDTIKYKRPENLIMEGSTNSLKCLKKLGKSKISLNVMPWFKNGAHDRIFNASLNGAVNVTDGSIFLHETFDSDSVCFYSLKNTDTLPDIIEELITNPELMQEKADKAYDIAKASHTWDKRAYVIADTIENI